MKKVFQTASTLAASLIITGSLLTQPAEAARFRVSQESAPGAGDFDNNVLGFIEPFSTTDTIADFYQYDNTNASFNGPVELTPDASHLFLVEAADGIGFFSVHDNPNYRTGGTANMQFDLQGDTASILVKDDPLPATGQQYTDNGTTFTTKHLWNIYYTDGVAIGSLDGDWTMFAQFTHVGFHAGGQLDSWLALSETGSSIDLALDIARKVRIDRVADVPEPSSIFGLVTALGGALVLKRKHK